VSSSPLPFGWATPSLGESSLYSPPIEESRGSCRSSPHLSPFRGMGAIFSRIGHVPSSSPLSMGGEERYVPLSFSFPLMQGSIYPSIASRDALGEKVYMRCSFCRKIPDSPPFCNAVALFRWY